MTDESVLALDLSKSVGWAFARGWAKPTFGVKELPRGTYVPDAKCFVIYEQWLDDMIRVEKPTSIIFEAPILTQEKGVAGDPYLLITLAGLTDWKCEKLGIDCVQATASEARRYFIGHAKGKSAELKADVGYRCRQLGWMTDNHNTADALCLLAYFRGMEFEPSTGQLLAGAAE
ncbi:MAG: hypothetical protein E6Q98_15895 [Rhodospirillaceae bacterium]|nr:MAG: hypothetical protein E6Q98_15895 [Rhodospirillaceae bacterium]